MEQKRSTIFFEVKDKQAKQVYDFLSEQEPEQPKGGNLVAVIGDIHGDLYTMLRSLVRYGIIKINKKIENGVEKYQIQEGEFRKKFKRVIFLGDYVDRGPSSLQCINNVIILNELFNEGNSNSKDDFMKFLCGNHDTLGYMSLMDYGIRGQNKEGIGQQNDTMYNFGLVRLGKMKVETQKEREYVNTVKTIIARFYKALSVAHVEELSGNKRVYFTHGYCTKDVKNDFDSYLSGVYPHTFNKGSVNSLDLTSGDFENGSWESKIESLHKYFWIREFEEEGAIAKPSQNSNDGNKDLTVRDKECRVRDQSELFIHGHDRMCCEEHSTAQDRFDANVGCTKRQLAECGAASMDYGNSAGYRAPLTYYENKTHASSCMIIDQDGNFTISGTASSLTEESKFVGKEFQVNGFSGCTFDPKDKRLAEQKKEIAQMKIDSKYAWQQIISAIKNNEKIKKILETYGNIDSLKCKSDGDIVNGQCEKDELYFIIGNYEIKMPIKNRYKDAYSLTQYVGTAPDIIVSPSLQIGKSYNNPIREITYKYSSELDKYENTVKFPSAQQDKIAILFKNYSELNSTRLHTIKFHLEESDGNNYICFQKNSKNYRIKVDKNFNIDENTQIECASSGQEYATLEKNLSIVELGSDLYTGMQQNSYIAPSVPAQAPKTAPASKTAPATKPVVPVVSSSIQVQPAPAPIVPASSSSKNSSSFKTSSFNCKINSSPSSKNRSSSSSNFTFNVKPNNRRKQKILL